jgi:hypothetical protein
MVGSSPKVSTTTTPTIDPAQSGLLNALAQMLGTQGLPGTLNFGDVQPQLAGTQYAAPLSGLQTGALGGIQNIVNAFAGSDFGTGSLTAGGESSGLDAIRRAQSSPVQMIDPTQAFNKGVVEPLTQDFNQQVIPVIAGRYGQGAGGAFSSDALGARQQAGTNLARTLAQTGSQYSLAAAQQNQQAQATNAQLGLAGANLLPQTLGLPFQIAGEQEQLLGGGLQAGAVPQQAQQAQLSGEQADYSQILQQIATRLQAALGLSTAGTQQTQSVVSPGSQGFLPGLVSAFAGGLSKSAFNPGWASGLLPF